MGRSWPLPPSGRGRLAREEAQEVCRIGSAHRGWARPRLGETGTWSPEPRQDGGLSGRASLRGTVRTTGRKPALPLSPSPLPLGCRVRWPLPGALLQGWLPDDPLWPWAESRMPLGGSRKGRGSGAGRGRSGPGLAPQS